jgi:hypothetical protein
MNRRCIMIVVVTGWGIVALTGDAFSQQNSLKEWPAPAPSAGIRPTLNLACRREE